MEDNNLFSEQPPHAGFDAAAVVKDLLSRPAGSVKWRSTRRCLVELIMEAAEERVLTDGHGRAASCHNLCDRVFRSVGLPPPRYPRTIVFRIRNRVRRQPPLEDRVREALGADPTPADPTPALPCREGEASPIR